MRPLTALYKLHAPLPETKVTATAVHNPLQQTHKTRKPNLKFTFETTSNHYAAPLGRCPKEAQPLWFGCAVGHQSCARRHALQEQEQQRWQLFLQATSLSWEPRVHCDGELWHQAELLPPEQSEQ
jgi:hypothetical protein